MVEVITKTSKFIQETYSNTEDGKDVIWFSTIQFKDQSVPRIEIHTGITGVNDSLYDEQITYDDTSVHRNTTGDIPMWMYTLSGVYVMGRHQEVLEGVYQRHMELLMSI